MARSGAQKITVFWRDIPTQINIKRGRTKGKALFSARFHEAVDRAAMRAGMGDTDSYVQQWRQEMTPIECGGDLDARAMEEMTKVEAEFPESVLDEMVKNGGVASSEES